MSPVTGPWDPERRARPTDAPTGQFVNADNGPDAPPLSHHPLPLPYADQPRPPMPRFISRPPQASPPLPRDGYHTATLPGSAYRQPHGAPAETAGIPPYRPLKKRRGNWKAIAWTVVLVASLILLLLAGLAIHRYTDFGHAISQQAPLSTQTNFMSGAGRVNLLVLGYGGAGHDGAYLTDSMIVMSLIPQDHATTIISVPRDLWVQVPPNSGQYAKINTAYQAGLYNGFNGLPAGRIAGGAEAAEKVSDVLGIPVNYWLTMDFDGFRQLVDSLGGVEINVPVAFTARYPANDDPSINPNWKIIHFNTGPQHMDGEQAIEYARARYVLSPASQGSDFARSVRQQLLISAILSRARQVSAWPKLLDATTALQNTVYTNLSVTDLSLFVLKLNFKNAGRIGLSDQNVLVDSQSSDGQDILLPDNGSWNTVAQYVAKNLQS